MLYAMTRFIALLRGVNVGGRTIKSVELADAFGSLGYDAVKPVLASGNVVFEAEGHASTARITELRSEIEKALSERFGYDAKVHVLDTDALAAVVDAYPFAERDGWHRYVVFLIGADPSPGASRTSEQDAVARAVLDLTLDEGLESVADGGAVIYWTVERGHTLDSTVGKRVGSGKSKELTTNRNLNTLRKLL